MPWRGSILKGQQLFRVQGVQRCGGQRIFFLSSANSAASSGWFAFTDFCNKFIQLSVDLLDEIRVAETGTI